jgi:hypothetical protein
LSGMTMEPFWSTWSPRVSLWRATPTTTREASVKQCGQYLSSAGFQGHLLALSNHKKTN